MSEYENEPIRGLPGHLPEGEHILWQGAPEWRTLAKTAFHVRTVAIYFGVLMAWRAGETLLAGGGLLAALASTAWLTIAAAAGLGLLALLAWLSARTTVYTITNRRVVLRFGIALPKAVNVPFTTIEGASLKRQADGAGDIAISVGGQRRIAYLQLWPHVRPWRLSQPQPTLRSVPQAGVAAQILAEALSGEATRRATNGAEPARAPDSILTPAVA